MTERTKRDAFAVAVGAGVGGSSSLEAHATPGGCAGFSSKGDLAFDAWVATLVGFDPGEALAALAEALGMRPGEDLHLAPVDGVGVRRPGLRFLHGRDDSLPGDAGVPPSRAPPASSSASGARPASSGRRAGPVRSSRSSPRGTRSAASASSTPGARPARRPDARERGSAR